jgi:hypothetical protein
VFLGAVVDVVVGGDERLDVRDVANSCVERHSLVEQVVGGKTYFTRGFFLVLLILTALVAAA